MMRAPVRRLLACTASALLLAATSAYAEGKDINEGELHFLREAPKTPPHRHTKHLTVTADSLTSGWVSNRQCHYELDRVSAMEIVFGKDRVRKLKVVRSQNIERVWVEGPTIQMTKIGADAFVCVESENKILARDLGDAYVLKSGPYMRRFLDGYFPMKVDLTVDYPANLLSVTGIEPQELKTTSTLAPGRVAVNALFEGRLMVSLHFVKRAPQHASAVSLRIAQE